MENVRAVVGQLRGFAVVEVRPFLIAGERVSSSGIRRAVEAGRLALAARLLAVAEGTTPSPDPQTDRRNPR